MASTFLGDIPGAKFPLPGASHASVASNGAVGRLIEVGVAPFDCRIQNAWWTPTGADQGTAASYRNVKLINGGTAGTGTVVVASLALSASKASLAPAAMTTVSANTIPAGAMIYASQDTVGGTDATGTVLRAGRFDLAYEVI